ncbi:MAG: hypothetical protein ACIARR_07170 [Phycisphaerales bacterium JB059]
MSTPNPDSTPPETDHDAVAGDRFVHGLLEFTHRDSEATQEARIAALMDRISNRRRSPRGGWRSLVRLAPLATAALLALVALSVFVFAPQPAAYAVVDAAIAATRSADELRYEIFASDGASVTDSDLPIGTLDMRTPLLRVRIETPHGTEFVMGRDETGPWSLRLDGSVERLHPRGAAPHWVNLGESTILVGSLDALLDRLRADYTISQIQGGPDASPAPGMTRLVADRRPGSTTPGADRVEVWIDPASSLVERLELHWTAHAAQSPRTGGRRAPPPGSPDRRRPPPPPPHDHRPPERGHPELLTGPPRFGEGRHPPPPTLVVFKRVPAPELPIDAFSPPSP